MKSPSYYNVHMLLHMYHYKTATNLQLDSSCPNNANIVVLRGVSRSVSCHSTGWVDFIVFTEVAMEWKQTFSLSVCLSNTVLCKVMS